jgi:hypothetical protein
MTWLLFSWVEMECGVKLPAVGGSAAAASLVSAGARVAGELMVVAAFTALPFPQSHVDELA